MLRHLAVIALSASELRDDPLHVLRQLTFDADKIWHHFWSNRVSAGRAYLALFGDAEDGTLWEDDRDPVWGLPKRDPFLFFVRSHAWAIQQRSAASIYAHRPSTLTDVHS